MQILPVFIIPLCLLLSGLFIRRLKFLSLFHNLGYLIIAFQSFWVFYHCAILGKPLYPFQSFFLLDALSSIFLFTISVVSFAASLYSTAYIGLDIEKGNLDITKAKRYYLFFDLFILAMFFVVTVNNLAFMWIGIEMTTLISAFLVGFYRVKESVEAAWKYIIVCSVGIVIALLGTILFYFAVYKAASSSSLNWTDIFSCAEGLDKNLVKAAFIFIFIGYGTKAGIAPMHTWLPDAHSQAISPISALLSGVLLKTAIYAIIRFGMIVNICLGNKSYSGNLLVFFGLICLAISSGLIFVQKDLKRLLAYSSIEHMGFICIGLGMGGMFGIIGALTHVFNHAVTKSLMFFSAGRIVSHYGKHNMNSIQGIISAMPFCGIVFLIGTFALCGFAPFSIFVSEFLIIAACFLKGAYWVCALLLLFMAAAFAGIILHFSKITFGRRPVDIKIASEPFSIKIAFLLLLVFIIFLGAGLPVFIHLGIFSNVLLFLGAA